MPTKHFNSHTVADCNFQLPECYALDSLIGGGGFGIVIKAKDKKTDQFVAIKRLKNPFNHLKNAIRTYREFEILQIVDHKNIIQLLNAYTPQENLNNFEEVYLVMEYMDYSLRVLINLRESQFQGENGGRKISYLIYQLLCGVNHLHQAGIVHRDLTPDNIMIDTKFHLKIVDFGTARKLANNEITKNVTTIWYSAPEVFYTNYTYTADIWSIGCIFAELLTGEVLFKGRNEYDQPFAIVNKVGSPDESYMSMIEPTARDYLRIIPRKNPTPWEVIFPNHVFPNDVRISFCSSINGRNMLSRMLVFNPDHRISVEQALNEPYVSWKRREDEIQNPPKRIYDVTIEMQDMSTNEWKSKVYTQALISIGLDF